MIIGIIFSFLPSLILSSLHEHGRKDFLEYQQMQLSLARYTLHGKTGLIAKSVKEVENFDPKTRAYTSSTD
jgi:hypothetical protein